MRVTVEQRDLMETQVQARKMYNLLNEVMDISRQLAEAVDRNDQVSVRMLVSMRQTPINQAKEADQALRLQCAADGRLRDLLAGGEAQTPEEVPLANQIASNARLLKQVINLDQILSRKVAREKSIYNREK